MVDTRRLGDIEINRILELEGPFLKASEMFAAATPEALDPHRSWLEPGALCPDTGRLILPVQSYLVRTRRHTILIDTCIGCRKSYDGIPGWRDRRDETWLHNLHSAGVRPAEIDYVFCTHFHADHCGWNTRYVDGRWVPTFANANYIFSRPEYAASEAGDSIVYRENVQPIMEAGLAVLVDMDYALDDEVWLEPTPGHTVGHVAVNLTSRGHRAVMCGDLMHSPVQCAHPDWSPRFDNDPGLAADTRKRFLDTHCETDTLVLTAHFPSPSVGHVVPRDRAYGFRYA